MTRISLTQKHRLTCVPKTAVFILLSVLVSTGCSRQDDSGTQQVTQLNAIATNLSGPCKTRLLTVGNDLISHKPHFLRVLKTNEQVAQPITRITGALHYNDRPSNIMLEAQPTPVGCDIRYNLSYQLDMPCMTAREEAFKKWLHQGKLGDKTQWYVHKRRPNKTAYLTNISRNLQCLVNVQVVEADDGKQASTASHATHDEGKVKNNKTMPSTS